MKHVFRGDSSIFAHVFTGCIVVTTGLVLGIGWLEWTVVILSLTLIFTSELFHQVLKSIHAALHEELADHTRSPLRIATAAVCVALCGAVLTIAIIFGCRLTEMLSGTPL